MHETCLIIIHEHNRLKSAKSALESAASIADLAGNQRVGMGLDKMTR